MFYEDRAAHFASSQLPLIVSLAGKNNILSCKRFLYIKPDILLIRFSAVLTGIGHEKVSAPRPYQVYNNLVLT